MRDQPTSNREAELTAIPRIGSGDWLDRSIVAALFVQENGCYAGLPGVDAWPESRDARLYAGPWPVVAHPPCQRWGKMWFGQPLTVKRTGVRKKKGEDGGCFAAALAAVRKWGGVLEHPASSNAWAAGLLGAEASTSVQICAVLSARPWPSQSFAMASASSIERIWPLEILSRAR